MPIRYPAQRPYRSVNEVRQDTAAANNVNNFNAMRTEQQQRNMDADEQLAIGQMFKGIGEQGLKWLQQDPNAWMKMRPEVVANFERHGLPTDKISNEITKPDVVARELQELANQGDMILSTLGTQPQAPSLVKDAEGYNRYASGEQFGQRAFPDAQKPEPGSSGGVTGSLQELNAINEDRKARGLEPIAPEKYLQQRRQSSAAMQAYNQYAIDAQRAGETPMSEADFAATRAGDIAGAKTTGSGEAQRQLDIPSAYALHSQTTQNFQRLSDAVSTLSGNESLWKAVGLYKSLAAVPGQEGANIRADIQNIKSQVGFMVLQDMRNASKTGGALGQVSGNENELLQSNLASLDENQSPEHFRKNLKIILQYLSQAQVRLDNAWVLTYPELNNDGQPYKPMTGQTTPIPENNDFQSQWDAAASGDVLEAPDGTLRRKP